jgi:hypothetical protein
LEGEGIIQKYRVGHPRVLGCAWTHRLDDSKKRQFFAVLHQGAIDSPQATVRAAIVSEFGRQKRIPKIWSELFPNF